MRLLILTQKMDMNDPVLGFFHRWVEEFARQCESVIVVCLFEGTHHLPENVRVLSLGKEAGISRLKYLRLFYTHIWKERGNYDAVFVHMNQVYVPLGVLIWRALRKRVGWWYAHGAVSLSMHVAEKCADIIFTSTPQGFRIPSRKLRIVGQGIDIELFKPSDRIPAQGLPIASVGRIEAVKHLDLLIRALAIIRKDRPDAELYLYGAPHEGGANHQEELQEIAHAEGVNEAVHFEGPIVYTDLPSALSRAAVFAQASQTGSLDKVVLEALAMNLPAVSTNIAFENIPGVVFTDQSSESIAEAIFGAIASPEPAREYVVREHSLSRLITRILKELK